MRKRISFYLVGVVLVFMGIGYRGELRPFKLKLLDRVKLNL